MRRPAPGYNLAMEELTAAQRIAIWALPVLFAITVHEVAHGWVASRLGDPTARMLGRLTLNPVKHIDPVGTLLVPGILLLLGGVIFGWAKPVPVTTENLRRPRRDMAIVAAAGPVANMVMAVFWGLVVKIGFVIGDAMSWIAQPLIYMGGAGITVNVVLAVLNLLPLPPLDGGRVLAGLLPGRLSTRVDRLEPYGFLIILTLLATGTLGYILGPPIGALQKIIYLSLGI